MTGITCFSANIVTERSGDGENRNWGGGEGGNREIESKRESEREGMNEYKYTLGSTFLCL